MMRSGLHTYGNFILIAGTGRNVGKTLLACNIIRMLSSRHNVTAVKISNHFHPVEPGQKIITDNTDYRIIEESLNSDKDSSRMKQAGAIVSYFIQCKQEHIFNAILSLPVDVANGPVVCESGGLHHYIKPGLFFLVEGDNIPGNKASMLQFNLVIVKNNNGVFNIDLNNIRFKKNCFTYNSIINEHI